MIIDDVVWEIINTTHCAFKLKNNTNTFCSSEDNVTGLCNRNSCPLGNSRYATVYETKGTCYLKIKTAERAHRPIDMWESIKLDANYNKAMEQIDTELEYFPEFLKHKCKMRFTRIRQILVRKRKILLEGKEEYKIVNRKAEKREKSRLVKAEKSAVIENHISQELLKNLREGKYDQIYNVDHKAFEKVLEMEGCEVEKEEEINEKDYDKGYIEDFDDEENEDESDEIDDKDEENNESNINTDKNIGKKRKRKLEYEKEYEPDKKATQTNNNDYLDDYI